MNIQAIHEILAQASKLTVDEQRELNRLLVEGLKRASKIKNIQSAAKFNLGDTVVFDGGPRKGLIKITISDFSRDGSKVKGIQIGGFNPGVRWTASAALCNKA